MKDFFDALSDFLSSDLAKDFRWTVLILLIGVIAITIFITSIIFNKLIIPMKLRESGDVSSEYQKVLGEISELKKENLELKEKLKEFSRMDGMIRAANSEDSETKLDGWEKKFLKKNKVLRTEKGKKGKKGD